MSTNEVYLATRRSLLPRGQRAPQYGTRHHQCASCNRETINPPGVKGTTWYQPLKATFDEAVSAAVAGCPFFQWIIDEVIRSKSPLGCQTFAIRFKCGLNDAVDIFSAEILVYNTEIYSWAAATFDVFADYGMQFNRCGLKGC